MLFIYRRVKKVEGYKGVRKNEGEKGKGFRVF